MNPGFSKEQVLVIDIPREDSVTSLLQGIKNQYASLPFVKKTSLVGYNSLPTSSMDVDEYETEYEGKNTTQIFNNIVVDENYLELLEIDLIEGTNFNNAETNENSVVVNESLVKSMNWANPLDQTFYRNSEAYRVVGVIKDFHFNSLHKIIEPIIIHNHPQRPEKLIVKVDKADYESIQQLESIWKASVRTPFEAGFLNSYVNEQYKNENTMRGVLKWFSVFTLIIACLGLFGLVAVFTTQKTKQFGIRKILGAGYQNIAFLVMKEFAWLVFIGAILALPLAWWSMELWLKQFPYKTTFAVVDFLWPVTITFLAAALSMSYHAIKASYVNPIESIKQS
jgi:putative ABC transport system permease protein